eukprot:351491-Chlamydomonas_euryale.AAC.33
MHARALRTCRAYPLQTAAMLAFQHRAASHRTIGLRRCGCAARDHGAGVRAQPTSQAGSRSAADHSLTAMQLLSCGAASLLFIGGPAGAVGLESIALPDTPGAPSLFGQMKADNQTKLDAADSSFENSDTLKVCSPWRPRRRICLHATCKTGREGVVSGLWPACTAGMRPLLVPICKGANVELAWKQPTTAQTLLERSKANKAKYKREIEDKYCYRQAELGIGDCGGLSLIPGMTENGKQETPQWLADLLGVEKPASVPQGRGIDSLFNREPEAAAPDVANPEARAE